MFKKLKRFFKKWKIINLDKYYFEPREILYRRFVLSEKEYLDAQRIYKEKGTISYTFIPTPIGDVVKVQVRETEEIIDITDYDVW